MIDVITAGPEDGKPVILLHGFPEFSYGWRKQMEPLARAGFRVIVPDQRGYNLSDKPPRVADYAVDLLTADVIAIADRLGYERVYLAGHDWGAAVAWNTAMRRPERVERLAVLNVPHPAAMLHRLLTSPRQMLRSWYILFFQIRGLPERVFRANHFEAGVRALVDSSRPGTFTEEDLARYREAWSQPGALTGMINWYRAISPRPSRAAGRVTAPTRIIWGDRDRFLLKEMADESVAYCDSAEVFHFPEATHWVHHEEPERVNRLLIEHFGA